MQSPLHCFGVGVFLFSLAPPTLSFSRGASQAACKEMIPGHIRAQPQDPQHSHVTLRTSTSSYLPGQLVTVTVRSSRDFMGFLLQARRVEAPKSRAGVRPGIGVRSTRLGRVLVGGSWVLTPPNTRTLRCLLEGDTITHSDKQLKRNLSFVWKAPNVPMGDVKFYITVVQSYFVYWAGIESTLVRDGSRSTWSGSNITGMDRGNSFFSLQEDEATALPVLKAHRASNKQTTERLGSATTIEPSTTTSSGTQSYNSQKTLKQVTHPVLEMKSSATLASLNVDLSNQGATERISIFTLGYRQNASKSSDTDMYESSGALSGVTEEAGTDYGSSVAALRSSTTTNSYIFQKKNIEVAGPALEMQSSVILTSPRVDHLPNQGANEGNNPLTSGSLQNASDSLSGVTEKSGTSRESLVTTLSPSETANSGAQEVTHPVLKFQSSTTFSTTSLRVNHLANQGGNDRNSALTLASLQNTSKGSETDIYAKTGFLSSVTEEAGTDKGSPIPHTDPKSSLGNLSNHLPVKASFSSAEARGMETTATLLPNVIVQNSTSPLSLASLPHVKDNVIERNKAKIILQDPKSPPVSSTKDNTTTNPSFHNTYFQRSKSQNPRAPIQDQTNSIHFRTQSTSSQPWRSSISESKMSQIRDETGSQNLQVKPLFHSQTSLSKPFLQVQTTPETLPPAQTATSQSLPYYLSYHESSSKPFPMSKTSSPKPILPSKSPTLQSFLKSHTTEPLFQANPQPLQPLLNKLLNVPSHNQTMSNLLATQPENSPPGSKTGPSQTSPTQPHLQTTTSLTSTPEAKPLSSFPRVLPETIQTQTEGQADFPQIDQSQSDTPTEAISISLQPWSQPNSQTSAPQVHTFLWKQTQSSVTPKSINPLPLTSKFDPAFKLDEGKGIKDYQYLTKIKPTSPIFASMSFTTPSPNSVPTHLSTPHSLSTSSTHTLLGSSLVHSSSTTPPHPTGGSNEASLKTSYTPMSFSSSPSSSAMKNQPKTAPALSALPPAYPISIPPNSSSSPSPMPSSLTSSAIPSSISSHYQSSSALLSASAWSPLTSNTSLAISSHFTSTTSPALSTSPTDLSSSSISSVRTPPLTAPISSSISTTLLTSSSMGSSSSSNSAAITYFLEFLSSTSPHPEPSPAPRRSLHNAIKSTPSPVPSQKLTLGQKLLIWHHIASSDPEPNLKQLSPRTVVQPNPEPSPNLESNFKQKFGHKLKPNLPNTDSKPKRPSNPSITPGKEGKYPDIIPRHSAWELGMLLGCSAGLGMVLVVGVRYMYRQACGKRTEVTLNDREREYGRGERGLIHVQECGDLVRVRRIRDNSFVLLAEYDILASPGD